ncbi:DUF2634 domain-containing protein [Desnuesiella massiliensis]|uniref:DUF2634 domain-containing protein n=1 Tax=Desnuesiella massiliensis TaxID=1650662 RepID=UPI0006E43125|nr:DUF2634 domain-containing protein [Desnuesiella massiliensis]
MSILPKGELNNSQLIRLKEPSKTYRVDFKNNKISGFAEGLDAVKQAAYLILNTERYEHPIYSWSYGSELKTLIGMDKAIAENELKRRIKEALLQDDRIEDVNDFIFEYYKDSVLIKFTIFSIYGEFNEEKVVI